MNAAKSLFAFVAFLLAPACSAAPAPPDTGKVEAASIDEVAEQKLIGDKVQNAIATSDFATLNAMEREFRISRARTPSGVWKLAVFHGYAQFYLADGLDREHGCVYRMAPFVKRWLDADPSAAGAVISDAALLFQQGGCERGSGFADSVSAAGWAAYHKGSDAAFNTLNSHRATASVDPEYYTVMIDVYRAQQRDRGEFDDLVAEASEREPYYLRTYFHAAWHYMPQWGGSYAELDRFARYAAERTRASHKTGFYARVYWSLEECGCELIAKAADWDTMKQAMRDVYERYPTNANGEAFKDFSCKKGDEEEALHYMRALHPDATSDADFAILVAACRVKARPKS